jgi:hypothetical protein
MYASPERKRPGLIILSSHLFSLEETNLLTHTFTIVSAHPHFSIFGQKEKQQGSAFLVTYFCLNNFPKLLRYQWKSGII